MRQFATETPDQPVEPLALPLAPEWEATTDTAAAFRALGDATRLQIMALLAAYGGELCVCNLVDAFPLSQPTISYHLNVLRNAGLIRAEKRGVWVYYAVRDNAIEKLGQALARMCKVVEGGRYGDGA